MKIPRTAIKVGDNEYKFPCPKCGHENHYYNIKKGVSYCHRASCHYTFHDVDYSPVEIKEEPKENKLSIHFPSDAVSIKYDKKVIEALQSRNISLETAIKYKLRSWRDYIQIPVYHKHKLVNLVQRKINRKETGKKIFSSVPHKERYLYIKGVSTTDYLFNWDDIAQTNQRGVVLIENTFNVLWFKRSFIFSLTTTFGSHLSDKQVELIRNSNVKYVLILWDQGASANKAINKLRKIGVRAENFFLRKGQPDDYNKQEIQKIIREGIHAISINKWENWITEQTLSVRYRT